MAMTIAILEDNSERCAAMHACLHERFPMYDIRFYTDAAALIAYLEDHLPETLAIALDHDLELQPNGDGTLRDPGTGREVADYLARRPPACPIIIHSSNSIAAAGMERTLQEAHWCTYRVAPYDDLAWIPTQWFRTMRKAIVATAQSPVATAARQQS